MQTVGEMLKEERERKGLTIKDVETVTNIRSLYLNAIETGNFSVLPGETYAKGFIRNYANALGLNGSDYVEYYRKSQQPSEILHSETVEEKVPEVQDNQNASPSVSTRRRQRSRKSELMWIGALLLLLAISGGIWKYMYAEQDSPQQHTLPQTQTQQQPTPSDSTQPQTPVQVTPAKSAEKPVVIVAKFLSQSWIQVTADDRLLYEGIPQVGGSMTWQANQKITLKVGNAGAVEVTHNGQAVGKLGENGEVVLKTFTPSGRQ